MTKDAQIRLLCEQQDQLNEEARKYKAEVARLTAELADRTDELAASHAIERDLLAVAQDYKTRLAAVEQERDGLAAALDEYGNHDFHCDDTRPDTKVCSCGFEKARERGASILATHDASVRKPLEEERDALAAVIEPFRKYIELRYAIFTEHALDSIPALQVSHTGRFGTSSAEITKADWDSIRYALIPGVGMVTDILAARDAEARKPLEEKVAELAASLDAAREYCVALSLPSVFMLLPDPAAILATVRAEARAEGLADYLTEAREFSRSTFGEGNRTLGVTKHIEKEIAEVRAKPFDLTEWVDIIILACDGYWRHGGEPENLLRDMMAKLAKNKARKWPKPISEDEAVEHDRTHDDPLNPELGPEHREYWVRKVRTEAFQERESAYVKISQQLLAKYVELFPAYARTDEQTAVDLMAAEIATLRIEKTKARAEGWNAGLSKAAAEARQMVYRGVGRYAGLTADELDRLADAEEAGKGSR